MEVGGAATWCCVGCVDRQCTVGGSCFFVCWYRALSVIFTLKYACIRVVQFIGTVVCSIALFRYALTEMHTSVIASAFSPCPCV